MTPYKNNCLSLPIRKILADFPVDSGLAKFIAKTRNYSFINLIYKWKK